MKPGEKVRLSGYPHRYPWMADLDGETGTIEKIDTDGNITVYGVSFGGVENLLWFGASYLESVQAERKSA